jgi:hypothetical protein
MGAAGGAMIVLSLPPRVLEHRLDGGAEALEDPEKYAIRAAVQVRPGSRPAPLRAAAAGAGRGAPPCPSTCRLASRAPSSGGPHLFLGRVFSRSSWGAPRRGPIPVATALFCIA